MASLINMSSSRLVGSKVLPYDAEIEYLESTGTQWIDTGVLPGIFPFAIKFNVQSNTAPGYGNVMGAREASNRREFVVSAYGSGVIGIGIRNYINIATKQINEVVYEGGSFILVNGVEHAINTNDNFVSDSIVLFGTRNNGIPTLFQAGKIYYCKLSNLRDFIPVRVGTTGYMYDKISGQLFGNAGTGAFILGADKTN